MQRMSGLSERLSAVQQLLCSMHLANQNAVLVSRFVWFARSEIPCIAYSGSVNVCVSNVDNYKRVSIHAMTRTVRSVVC